MYLFNILNDLKLLFISHFYLNKTLHNLEFIFIKILYLF